MNAVLFGTVPVEDHSLERLLGAAGCTVCPIETASGSNKPLDEPELERLLRERRLLCDTVVLVNVQEGGAATAVRIVRWLRRKKARLPVALISPPLHDRKAKAAVLAALRAGADDFFTRSTDPVEVALRLHALMERHRRRGSMSEFCVADVEVLRASRVIGCGDKMVTLTACEYRTFQCLARRMGSPVARELLLRRLRKSERATTSNMVDVYILYLRRKLKEIGTRCTIRTVRGVGYMLISEPAGAPASGGYSSRGLPLRELVGGDR